MQDPFPQQSHEREVFGTVPAITRIVSRWTNGKIEGPLSGVQNFGFGRPHRIHFILQKLVPMKLRKKARTESYFRDCLVHQIIQQYGVQNPSPSNALISYHTLHGSKAFQYSERAAGVLYVKWRCPDCPFTPALCQTATKDCHSIWHSEHHDCLRTAWFISRRARTTGHRAMPLSRADLSATVSNKSLKRGPGRPKGSGDKRKKKKRWTLINFSMKIYTFFV